VKKLLKTWKILLLVALLVTPSLYPLVIGDTDWDCEPCKNMLYGLVAIEYLVKHYKS